MILVCGEALFDVFMKRDTGTVVPMEAHPGGSPFNVAIGLARLGQGVAFLGGISSDMMGARLLRFLEAEKVSSSLVQCSARPTTLSLIGLDDNGTPAYAFYGEGAADRWLDLDQIKVPEDVTAIHIGSYACVVPPAGDVLEALVKRESGSRLIAYDPNIRLNVEPDITRWQAKLAALVPFVHIIKISDEDFGHLYPGEDPADHAREWITKGTRLVVLTRGAKGITAWTRDHTITLPSASISMVDSVGAGDTFQAALLAGLAETGGATTAHLESLNHDQLVRVLSFAIQAAGVTCSRRGADMPHRGDIAASP